MKYIFCGGGTAGHLYPGIAVAQKLIKQHNEVMFIGVRGKLEEVIVPKNGFEIKFISSAGISRKFTPRIFTQIWENIKGFFQSFRIIKEYKPKLIFATGGFVCVPVCLAAYFSGVPVIIHEQNAYPGIANRLVSLFAKITSLTYDESRVYFKRKCTCVLTGNPVREEIESLAFENHEPKYSKKTLLVMGGSQGADKINNALINGIENLSNIDGMHIILSTGRNNYASVNEKVIKIMDNLSMYGLVEVVPFIEDMRTALQDADLIVSRAGATTIAEIKCAGKPAILIPYPYATGDHQTFNAKSAITQGFAYMISNSEINDKLVPVIKELLSDGDLLDRMGKKALECNSNNASAVLSELITKCANQYN